MYRMLNLPKFFGDSSKMDIESLVKWNRVLPAFSSEAFPA